MYMDKDIMTFVIQDGAFESRVFNDIYTYFI